MSDPARERLAELGALVTSIAHEARNPLFAISATLDAIEARGGAGGPQHVAALRREVDRLRRLMQDLLDYARAGTLERTPCSLSAAAREAAASCSALAEARGVKLDERLADDLPPVDADLAQLTRAVRNLVENAIQHTGRHGAIEVETRCEAGTLLCAVRDRGPGFVAEDLPLRWAPFHTRRSGGTGLGLAIAMRVAEAHGGTVAARNREGGGAEVELSLPLPASPPAERR